MAFAAMVLRACLACAGLVGLVMLGDWVSAAVGGSDEGWAKPPKRPDGEP